MDGVLTRTPRAIRRYFQPRFSDDTSQGAGAGGHEWPGITASPMTADITEPKEKKTDRAVTKYCFPLGICSSSSVPSVGIEP